MVAKLTTWQQQAAREAAEADAAAKAAWAEAHTAQVIAGDPPPDPDPGPDDGDGDGEPDLERPALNASTEEWAAYATALGLTLTGGETRTELIALVDALG